MRSFEELIALAEARGKRRLALLFVADPETLLAVERAVRSGVARALFLGREREIDAAKAELGLVFADERLAAPGPEAAAELAARLILKGEVEIAAVASLEAALALGERLDRLQERPVPSAFSLLILFEPAGWNRLFLLTSPPPGAAPAPELLRLLIRRAVAVAQRLGAALPTVALIQTGEPSRFDPWSAWGTGALPAAAGREGDWRAVGPLSLGEAIALEPNGRAAGSAREVADILVTSEACIADAIRDTLSSFTRCRFAHLVAGAAVPIAAALAEDSFTTRFNSIALASLVGAEVA